MQPGKANLQHLNTCGRDEFVRICGPLFEHSPWIAERAFSARPFASVEGLHQALCSAMRSATPDEQVKLLGSHPDLAGKLAREGRLTGESTAEQRAAGLAGMTSDQIAQFDRYNAAYRAKFGFPFVICARENQLDAILAAFPVRLQNSRAVEIETALKEVAKIARFRLLDAVEGD